jgi:hypothetical protein
MSSNPFRPTRYEHQNSPLLWYSEQTRQLESAGSFYVSGTRGSGKTSLLKTLHWRERLTNQVLKAQLPALGQRFLSVYFRIPDHVSFAFSRTKWRAIVPNAPDPRAVSYAYFSMLIELISVQLMLEAIEECSGSIVKFSAIDASKTLDIIVNSYPELVSNSADRPTTLRQLAKLIGTLHRSMNIAVVRGDVSLITSLMPTREPGSLVHEIAEQLIQLIQQSDFHFKICLDDCEVLDTEQQIYLNSLVRRTRSPVSWIISYVGREYEATTGLHKDHNLTDADRKVVDLDSQHESSFVRLCEAVSSLRVFYSLSDDLRTQELFSDIDKIFSAQSVLGSFSVNELFDYATRDSLSADLVEFRKQAEKLAKVGNQAHSQSGRAQSLREIASRDRALPYYQAYLLSELMPQMPFSKLAALSVPELKRQAAYLRRKQRSALIAMCQQFRVRNIPYAGSNVVFGLSDGCIRDYLEIMAEIYDAFSTPKNKLKKFFQRRDPLKIDLQRQGIVRAANSKFSGIKNSGDAYSVELGQLVDCLGELTALLHRDVKTTERGVYAIDPSSLRRSSSATHEHALQLILDVLSRGESDGLFRGEVNTIAAEMLNSPQPIRIRLHRRFAPRYGFSFRGPYEPAFLPADMVAEVCQTPATVDAKAWASAASQRMAVTDPLQEELSL